MSTDRPIKEFLSESEDILDAAKQALLTLEDQEASGRPDPETVNALFRAVHSFKGLAGMFGLKAPSDLSHRMESLLDGVRLGRVGLNVRVLDLLHRTVAQLGRLVKQAGAKQAFEDIAPALGDIDEVLRKREGVCAPAEAGPAEVLDINPAILGVLTEYEEHRLRENIRERAGIFLVRAVFSLNDFEVGIKRLTDALKREGEVLCTLPTAGAAPGSIGFTLLVGSAAGRIALESAAAEPNVSIEAVPYRKTVRQDAPRAEASRMEAGDLRSVSNTVRVDIHRLDSLMNSVGELHLTKNVIARLVKELRAEKGFIGIAVNLQKAHRNLERKLNELQEGILAVRMVPLGQIFTRLAQAVRKYARETGKEIDIQLHGEETELDKLMIEDLADPLMHLIRNAVDHGIEHPDDRVRSGKPAQGVIRLSGFPKGNHVVVTVEDDGAGIPVRAVLDKAVRKGLVPPDHGLDPVADRKEVLDLIFLPGLSTSEEITEISGRGVGMDVVKRNISKLSGMIDIETVEGEGTRFSLTLPITLAIIKALIVESGGRTFAIPLSAVLEILQVSADAIETVEAREVMAIRGDTVPLLRLTSAFKLQADTARGAFYVILVGMAERRLGIVVDMMRDQQEIVIKPISKRFSEIPGIAGATELGDDRGVVLVLDVESLSEGASRRGRGAAATSKT